MKLYALPMSVNSRLATLTLDVLEIDYEFITVKLFEGEHMKPEFLKINPQHQVPVLVDGDLTLNQSRPIAMYLAQKYDTKNILVPADCPKTSAIINQRIFFEAGVLADRFGSLYLPNMFRGKKEKPTTEEKTKLAEAMGWFEGYLKPTGFVAGTKTFSLADLCFLPGYANMVMTKDIYVNLDDYPETQKWFANMKTLIPNYEKVNGAGAKDFSNVFAKMTGFEI